MSRYGEVSGVIKSSYGYHVVKFFGRRVTPFDAVRDRILQLLYHQNLDIQFSKWIAQRRKESEIKIYMQDYIKNTAR
jgi:parvulin-like peptidyl-prolyl isomerase